MKHFWKWFVTASVIMMMLFTSCQMGGVNASADTSVEVDNSEKYGNIMINLPDTSRGWTPAKYVVTASREGENDVVAETTKKTLNMRLKVGDWSFVAQALDDSNVLIYQSRPKTSTVMETNSSISLLLDKQAVAVKYNFLANELLTTTYPLDKIKMTAVCNTSGFDSITEEVYDLNQSITLRGLLANAKYSVTINGYVGDVVYATTTFTQPAISDTTQVVAGGAKTLTQKKVTPVKFDKINGSSFSQTTIIHLSCDMEDAVIHYTTDGKTPNASSTTYDKDDGITVGSGWESGKTIKAVAVKSGLNNSEVASATYTFTPGVASTPSFSIQGGTYTTSPVEVALTTTESGTIKYSDDEKNTWKTYNGSISISGNGTTKTIYAYVTGVADKTDSAIVSQTYTIAFPQLAKVSISPQPGSFYNTQLFTLSASVEGATIYYTTDGTDPTTSSTQYVAPFSLAAKEGTYTIKAISVKGGYTDSAIATFAGYTITEDSISGGFSLDLADQLTKDNVNPVWTNENNDSFDVGNNGYVAYGLSANKSYELTWTPADISAAVTVYKNKKDTVINSDRNANSITFSTDSSTTAEDGYYFFFNATASAANVQLSLSQSGTVILVTGLAITPNTELTIEIGATKTFGVTYTPANATGNKNVTWSVSNSSVLALNGTTVTGLSAGKSDVIVTLENRTLSNSVEVTVVAPATTTTTTTTIAPVNNTALGEKHPSTGALSPVGESNWGSTAYTLGANVSGGNTTFALYSKNATKVLLEIYDTAYGTDAKYDYWMKKNSSSNQWQAKLSGDLAGKYYAFRVWGPNWTYSDSWQRGNSSAGFSKDYDSTGNRFNPNKVVFDPYAREISHDKSNPTALGTHDGGMYGTGAETYKGVVRRNFDTGKYAPKAIVVNDGTDYGTKPQIAAKDAIIYEAHARGLTKHQSVTSLSSILSGISGFENVVSVPAEYRGTYKGAAYMAKYLKALGINTIELLPVHESDNDGNLDGSAGGNYWAYMTYGYFAPDRRYSYDKTPGGPTKEFKEMVKAFHDEGMEVYLDVVYNHSGEGGPWYATTDNYNTAEITFMRGIDCSEYYCLTPGAVGDHWQTTGCGNNLRCDNPPVRKLVIDSLTYWIDQMGVDGFRFDLAPVLGRQSNGSGWAFSSSATTLTQIASLGSSKNAEMIAEAWDCHGQDGYQVGNFPSGWGEWNGRFRDSIRNFVGNGVRGALNDYINGDYSNFNDQGGPQRSVNFVVAHDGYTLADLCSGYTVAGPSYNGTDGPLAWPFGPSDGGDGSAPGSAFGSEPANKRQANRNYTAIQMISRGVPMIVWGDEFNRTQNGNNNPYNVDSVATWNNYNMINTSSPHLVATGDQTGGTMAYHNNFGTYANTENINGNFKFMQYMLNLRKNEPALRQDTYNVGYSFKKENGTTDLEDGDRCVWIRINGSSVTGGHDYLVFMNMYTAEVPFTIPAPASGCRWTRVVDTAAWAEVNCNVWDDTDTVCTYSSADSYGVNPWAVVIMKQIANNPTCETPTISGTNNFTTNSSITISCATTGASIYYTTNGATPTTSSTPYSGAFTINSTTTVKAIAVKAGYNNSTVATLKFTKNAPTCATPVISGTTPFETSTSVSISCASPVGASIYYTTNGNDPTTSSTHYSGSFTLTQTTTVKAIAVYNGYENSEVVTKRFTVKTTSNGSGVMLQGFTWNSAPRGTSWNAENPSPHWGKWYQTMISRASDIKNTFAYVWCPPPSKTDSASAEGYAPTQLNDLNSFYGTASELTSMIEAISPAKAIADIVINHRAGTTSWGDFTNPSWCEDYYAICSNDEGFTSSNSPMYNSPKHGAADTGDGYSAYRDIDHTNLQVQQGIKDWMNNVLKAIGFVGWRYDYVKGYGAQYVGMYNAATDAEFSVGEYWPSANYSPSGSWGSEIKNWVAGTATNSGKKSKAFDFALKGAMNNVFGCSWNGGGAEGSYNFGLLASTENLYISQPEDAVTFVDNHDTGSNQGHWALNPNCLGVAYALILTHPGYPCVSWSHYFTFAESGSRESTYPYSGITASSSYLASNPVGGSSMSFNLRQHIDYLIELRKDLGIEYNSARQTIEATSSHYVAKIDGTNGSVIVEIGYGWSKPSSYSDYEIVYCGDNFCIYTNDTSKCSAPSITFNNGMCTLSCSTQGATIKWSTSQNGTYTSYSAPFAVTDGQTIWAYATAAGLDDSAKVSKVYSSAITLHFTNNYGWSTVYAYFFNTNAVGAAWPGTAISQSYTNDMSQGVHTVTVPAGANYVIFNNGSGTQTENITLPNSNIGYYISGGEANSYTVGTWTP